MSQRRSETRAGLTLPPEVLNLIGRKLRHVRQEQDKRWSGIMRAAWSRLRIEISENLQSGRTDAAIIATLVSVYEEIVTEATVVTKEWPKVVWETIVPILEDANQAPADEQAINEIIDVHAWPIGEKPFTLDLIDPVRFKDSVLREIRSYGLEAPRSFNRAFSHAASLAQCSITNTARLARGDVDISIEEYLLRRQSTRLPHETEAERHLSNTKGSGDPWRTGATSVDCLPNPPKRQDDWFLAIRELAAEFFREYRRCPNEGEAWGRLRSNPPSAYGITSGTDRGEQAVFMHDQPLGRRAFGDRWKRYSRAKKPQ